MSFGQKKRVTIASVLVQPYSGDIVVTLPAGQDEDTLIWIKQDRPQPFRLVAISADIDFGEV